MTTRTLRERLLAEVEALERARLHGQRLKLLRERLGLKKSALSDRLGFGTTQAYDLYERGQSIIRLDRIVAWAAAFEMSRHDFLEAVMGEESPAPWSLEYELRTADIPEWAVRRALDAAHGEPQLIQRWIAEKLIDMHVSGEISDAPPLDCNTSPLAFLRRA